MWPHVLHVLLLMVWCGKHTCEHTQTAQFAVKHPQHHNCCNIPPTEGRVPACALLAVCCLASSA